MAELARITQIVAEFKRNFPALQLDNQDLIDIGIQWRQGHRRDDLNIGLNNFLRQLYAGDINPNAPLAEAGWQPPPNLNAIPFRNVPQGAEDPLSYGEIVNGDLMVNAQQDEGRTSYDQGEYFRNTNQNHALRQAVAQDPRHPVSRRPLLPAGLIRYRARLVDPAAPAPVPVPAPVPAPAPAPMPVQPVDNPGQGIGIRETNSAGYRAALLNFEQGILRVFAQHGRQPRGGTRRRKNKKSKSRKH